MESLRKGDVVSFSGMEAEVTDFGVCLRQCDQQAASIRLELKSPISGSISYFLSIVRDLS